MAAGGLSSVANYAVYNTYMGEKVTLNGMVSNFVTGAVIAGLFYGAEKLVSKGMTYLQGKLSNSVKTSSSGSITNPNNISSRPEQIHHFATNKNKQYTPKFEEITGKYGLDLDGAWNKQSMPHQGRHPNNYHKYILSEMRNIDNIAQGSKGKFLDMFEGVKKTITDNPDMLRKAFWQ